MNRIIDTSQYTFSASAGTVTFVSVIPISQAHIRLVANITRGVIYYDPENMPERKATWSSPTLTLQAGFGDAANGDRLYIAIEDPSFEDGGGSITVDGTSYLSNPTITRPANTTAYSAGQAIGDTGGSAIITFSNIGPSGGFVLFQSLALMVYTATPIASAFRLHLYTTSPTAIANGGAWDLVSGDRTAYRNYIDFPTPTDLGSTLLSLVDWPGKLIKLANGSTSLFGILQCVTGFTPSENSTVYDLRVNTVEYGR